MTELEDRILKAHDLYPNISDRELASIIGCHHATVSDIIKKYCRNEELRKLQELQDTIAPKLVHDTKFVGDGIITADHHSPCTDLRLVEFVIEHAKQFNIKRLFDIGDFFNFDALSGFAKKMGGDANLPTVKQEMEVGKRILEKYSEVFDEIYLLKGNHEYRFERCVSNNLSFAIVIDSLKLPKVKVIDNSYIYLDDIRFSHPKSYSQLKLSVAKRLTLKNMESTFSAHGHFATWGFSDNGLPCGDIPCMADPDRVSYLQGGETTYPAWNRGFIMYVDGQIYPRAKRFGLKF